jgi:positive regulator of sigma E activity
VISALVILVCVAFAFYIGRRYERITREADEWDRGEW